MEFEKFISLVFLKPFKIFAILIAAWIFTIIGKIAIKRIVASIAQRCKSVLKKNKKIQEQRIETLVSVFNSTLVAVIWIIAILTILPELGVNIGPLLAGAGIAGLAIGMGARNLIQDYFSGLFILMEDHYRVGEEVNILGTQGKVLDLNLRRTIIQDQEGVIHIFPNGQINKVSNFSRK